MQRWPLVQKRLRVKVSSCKSVPSCIFDSYPPQVYLHVEYTSETDKNRILKYISLYLNRIMFFYFLTTKGSSFLCKWNYHIVIFYNDTLVKKLFKIKRCKNTMKTESIWMYKYEVGKLRPLKLISATRSVVFTLKQQSFFAVIKNFNLALNLVSLISSPLILHTLKYFRFKIDIFCWTLKLF